MTEAPAPGRVFLSYSSKDKAWADAACAALEADGLRCWVAPRDIVPGTEYMAAIIAGIDACRVMVLIFSGHANESPQVRREVERAVSKGLVIVPVRIENVRPVGAMEYALGNTQWLDVFNSPESERLKCLAASVRAALTAAGSPPPVAAPNGPPASRPRRSPVWIATGGAVAVAAILVIWLALRPPAAGTSSDSPPTTPPAPPHYKGQIDVLIEREVNGRPRLLRLNEPGALPLKKEDGFRIEAEVDPPAYVYVIWIDPNHDLTPVYPWDPAKGWGSRPSTEEPTPKVSLPPNRGERYRAPPAPTGVATMVLLARLTPLPASDDEVKAWFATLPQLPLPAGGDGAAVWFDDYAEVTDPLRRRTFGVVKSNDPFAQWQGELQRRVGSAANFETAVSFARTGGK